MKKKQLMTNLESALKKSGKQVEEALKEADKAAAQAKKAYSVVTEPSFCGGFSL